MDEAAWLKGDSVSAMLLHLTGERGANRTARGRRKLRLFVCACLRRAREALRRDPGLRELVQAAEAMADGAAPVIAGHAAGGLVPVADASPGLLYLRHAAAGALSTRHLSAHVHSSVQLLRMVVGPFAGGGSGPDQLSSWQGLQLDLSAQAAEEAAQARLLHDVFGNPFRPPANRRGRRGRSLPSRGTSKAATSSIG
jgi:hypothetical protein